MSFIPKNAKETRTAVKLLIPTYSAYNGVRRAVYPATGDVIMANWKSYGGKDAVVNGVYSVIDTAVVTTRYRPDIQSNCRFLRPDGAVYEIKGEPENVDMANRWLICKVERVKGGT